MNLEFAQRTVEVLRENNLLPADVQIEVRAALASPEGQLAVETCTAAALEGAPTQCEPSLVAAALPPLPVNVAGPEASARPPGRASPQLWQVGVISETLPAMGILTVLTPLVDEVFDVDGAPATLEPGDYRVDFLQERGGTWMAQLEGVDQGETVQRYYVRVEVVLAQGTALDAGTQAEVTENAASTVILDPVFWSLCHSQGSGARCSDVERKRSFGLNFGNGVGWCDAIGGC